MTRFFIVAFFIFGFSSLNAQIHEVGVFLGGSNYIGDIGKMSYVSPNQPAFGVIYKWNRSPRHSWRFSAVMSQLKANDLDSPDPAKQIRGYSFKNDILEVSAGLEFDFFEFNLHESEPQFTPYIYTGLSYIHYNGLFWLTGDTQPRYDAKHDGIALPMIVGFKGRLSENLVLGAEIGARMAFKDDLDGSNPTNKSLAPFAFGNTHSNDWYVFTGITLTYTFGNKPCFCAD
jgi:hypothetical protein